MKTRGAVRHAIEAMGIHCGYKRARDWCARKYGVNISAQTYYQQRANLLASGSLSDNALKNGGYLNTAPSKHGLKTQLSDASRGAKEAKIESVSVTTSPPGLSPQTLVIPALPAKLVEEVSALVVEHGTERVCMALLSISCCGK